MKNFKVALQLYSVRDYMEKDMDATLKAVADMGYEYVEFAGFFDKTAEEVRSMLDKYGLTAISVHQTYFPILEDPEYWVKYLKTLGVKFCAMPWMGAEKHKGTDEFENTVEEFKKVGKILKDAGIQFLYHNHEFEFETVDGKYKLDWLYESVPADLLETQIDSCWVRYAGEDPAAYIRKYTGRTQIVHLKDFTCKAFNSGAAYALIGDDGKEQKKPTREDNGFVFLPLGMGLQDFKSILEASEDAGADYVVVEQDQSIGRTSLEAVAISRKFLKDNFNI